MSINSGAIPTYLNEFKSLKLNGVIRDMKKLSPDELVKVKKEIDKLLHYEDQNA